MVSEDGSGATPYIISAAIIAGILILLGLVSCRQNDLPSTQEGNDKDAYLGQMNNCNSMKSADSVFATSVYSEYAPEVYSAQSEVYSDEAIPFYEYETPGIYSEDTILLDNSILLSSWNSPISFFFKTAD